MAEDTKSFILSHIGKLAQAGITTIAQAQALQNAAPAAGPRKKGGCTPCAAKAAVQAAKARVRAGKI